MHKAQAVQKDQNLDTVEGMASKSTEKLTKWDIIFSFFSYIIIFHFEWSCSFLN